MGVVGAGTSSGEPRILKGAASRSNCFEAGGFDRIGVGVDLRIGVGSAAAGLRLFLWRASRRASRRAFRRARRDPCRVAARDHVALFGLEGRVIEAEAGREHFVGGVTWSGAKRDFPLPGIAQTEDSDHPFRPTR